LNKIKYFYPKFFRKCSFIKATYFLTAKKMVDLRYDTLKIDISNISQKKTVLLNLAKKLY